MNRKATRTLLLVICGIILANLTFIGFAAPRTSSAKVIPAGKTKLQEFTYSQLQMAMPMHLCVWCESEAAAQESCKLAFARASELVKIFSDYDPDSEINQLLDAETGLPHPVSRELFEVLSFSQRLHRDSRGAFDPCSGRLLLLWREARKTKELPDEALLRSTRDKAGFENLVLDPKNQTVTLLAKGMRLDFGGVAKGYIGDQVIETLRQHNVNSAKYHAGGDIVLGASPPNSTGWVIQIASRDGSAEEQRLSQCGLSTSGDRNQFVEVNGVRYSHVVDPRSGKGVTSGRRTVVVAPCGMQSDAIATVGCILDEDALQQLTMLYAGVSAWSNDETLLN